MEAFVVGTGVGEVAGMVVGTVVGVGVITGGSGSKQPAATRSTASTSAEIRTVRKFMKGIFPLSI
jgi:hypothetical protein